MQQTLYGDLSSTDRTAQYNVTVPTVLLEEGYGGFATAAGGAQGEIDALTIALHELGHHLGVTNALPKAVSEFQADNDFDLPASLLAGRVMAVKTTDIFGHFVLALDLTDPANPVVTGDKLMQPSNPIGYRRLPSATDVLAAAKVGEWTNIDLRRQDLLAGSTWNAPSNWEGGRVPDSVDDQGHRIKTSLKQESF